MIIIGIFLISRILGLLQTLKILFNYVLHNTRGKLVETASKKNAIHLFAIALDCG